MRRALLAVVLLGCLVVAVLPAFAADQGVVVEDNSFAPSEVTIQRGETVTWTSTSSSNDHNVHFDGEPQLNEPSTRFTVAKRFDADGLYTYRCDIHSSMTGKVRVGAGASATPTATATVTATPTTSAGPSPGGGAPPAVGGSGTAQTEAAGITAFSARAARSSFCTRRSAKCRRPGVFLNTNLAADASVVARGRLRRAPLRGGRSRSVGTVRITVTPGRHRVRLKTRRRLTPGRYTLTLAAGTLTRTVRFRVR